jgi:hypothetical protein
MTVIHTVRTLCVYNTKCFELILATTVSENQVFIFIFFKSVNFQSLACRQLIRDFSDIDSTLFLCLRAVITAHDVKSYTFVTCYTANVILIYLF